MKTKALAPERTLARVCREAGATVRFNAKLRDMNLLSVDADDERAIEVPASGLPLVKTRNASTPNFSRTTGVVWSSLLWRPEEGAKRPCSSWRVWLCLGLERYHPLCNTLRHSHGDESGPGHSLCRAHWWFHPKFLMPWQVLTAHSDC